MSKAAQEIAEEWIPDGPCCIEQRRGLSTEIQAALDAKATALLAEESINCEHPGTAPCPVCEQIFRAVMRERARCIAGAKLIAQKKIAVIAEARYETDSAWRDAYWSGASNAAVDIRDAIGDPDRH